MSGKRGLGIKSASSILISPCPSMIDSFFKDQLKYNKVQVEDKSNTNPYLVRYVKGLNHGDNPLFPDLANISCVSNIIIDLYNGRVVDHYFKINRGSAIRAYKECSTLGHLTWMFQYHLNLVHMTREYIKGGWMQRVKVQKEIEDVKSKYIILNKKGFTNILEKAKPSTEDEVVIE